ncbi:hypothetical protein BDZ89DRAFT_1071869 [Hymenopellis radicata]|nr:hypothetical protein BDZ89DRAFT_1071869 [Hymenopellis radicata]
MSIISLTHGPALVGIFLACILYGAMLVQCFIFFTNYSKDALWIKSYVVLLLVTDTLSTVFAMWWIYNLLINNFQNLAAFATADWLLAADPALVGITGTLCQLFFAYRIKVLTGNTWLGYGIAFLSVASGLCAIGSGIAVSWVKFLADFDKFQSIGCLWLGLTALVDILITIIVSSFLNQRRTGFRKTTQLLNRIVRVTIANGLMTTIFAIVELSLYVGKPDTGLHIGFSFVLPKLYCNSVMSSLNARMPRGGSSMDDHSISVTDPSFLHPDQTSRPEVFIQVDTERHEMYDLNKQTEWNDNDTSKARPMAV